MKICLFLFLGVNLLLVSRSLAADYFVSPAGSDANPGTQDQPFGTLAKVVSVVQPGDTCWLREGVYREVLKPQSSGSEGKPITFKAWTGEHIVISGLDAVNGWKPAAGNGTIWEAPVGWDLKDENQVFCAGKMMFEARWPHKKTDDPMNPEGAVVKANSGTDLKSFVCDAVPDFPPDVWQGATLWMLAQSQWSAWTAPLTGYNVAEKRLSYGEIPLPIYKWWVLERHLPGAGKKNISTFYISGNRALLQAPGEWFFDAATDRLSLIPPGGHEADFSEKIEVKRRSLAIDLTGLSYIHISGVEVIGATLTLKDAKHCEIEQMKVSYICHSRGGSTINHLPDGKGMGVLISGENNLVRDSEIGWSAGNGVTLQGRRNRVINCYIHDCDYFGSYNKPVAMEGEENVLSHCTIARAGRDCVQPTGINDRVEFNDISQAGLICEDLAMVYSAGRDGGNTEIAYNWVHDAMKPMSAGIYLDNYTRDYIVHHNVIWGIAWTALAMNRPSDYNMIFNNTVYGQVGSIWGPWKNPVLMPGCRIINNAVGRTIVATSDVQQVANVEKFQMGASKPQVVPTPPIPDAPGVVLSGITPPDAGEHPSIGAYQTGVPRWTAGWDPKAHPEVVFQEAQTPLRNLLVNSSFDFHKGVLAPWQVQPGCVAKPEHFDGFNFPAAEKRNAIFDFSLHFPPGKGEVFQDLKNLPPGKPLILGGYARGFDQAEVAIRFENSDGTSYPVSFPSTGDWVYQKVIIPAKADRISGRVVITKTGGGDAYFDNLGLSIDGL